MATKLGGRPRIDDGRHVRAMAIRISHETLDRFRQIVETSDDTRSMAQVLGQLVERYVDEHSTVGTV